MAASAVFSRSLQTGGDIEGEDGAVVRTTERPLDVSQCLAVVAPREGDAFDLKRSPVIRTGWLLAVEPDPEVMRLLRRSLVIQKRTGLRLQDGNQIECLDQLPVLGLLLIGKRSLVRLVRQCINEGLRFGIGPEIDQPLGNLGCQAGGERVEKAVQKVVRKGLAHIAIIPATAYGSEIANSRRPPQGPCCPRSSFCRETVPVAGVVADFLRTVCSTPGARR